MSLDVFAVTTGDGEGGNEHAREAKLLSCLVWESWREKVSISCHLWLLSRAERDVRLHQAALSF